MITLRGMSEKSRVLRLRVPERPLGPQQIVGDLLDLGVRRRSAHRSACRAIRAAQAATLRQWRSRTKSPREIPSQEMRVVANFALIQIPPESAGEDAGGAGRMATGPRFQRGASQGRVVVRHVEVVVGCQGPLTSFISNSLTSLRHRSASQRSREQLANPLCGGAAGTAESSRWVSRSRRQEGNRTDLLAQLSGIAEMRDARIQS